MLSESLHLCTAEGAAEILQCSLRRGEAMCECAARVAEGNPRWDAMAQSRIHVDNTTASHGSSLGTPGRASETFG